MAKSKQLSNIRRILIRSANWVGDAIMTTPAVEAIRRNFPGAGITLLAKPWVLPVFAHNPHVDEVMVYEADGRHRGALGTLRLSRDLRRRRFDLAILFQNAFEAALISRLAGIPNRLGFTTDARTLLLTHRVRTWPALKKGHLVDYYNGLLADAGLTVVHRHLQLFIQPEEFQAARRMLVKMGIAGDIPIVGINPGATYGTAKRWPRDRFVELSRRLIRQRHSQVLVFGGPGEARLGAEIGRRVGPGCHDLCARTSLREAMALIGCCHAFVTNDSGLMHVAAALDIPQVAIIGPTDATATGPVGRASQMIRREGICDLAPCLKVDCPTDHRCMTAIDVDDVLSMVQDMLPAGETA